MAIIIERTITVKNDQATLDSPLYLYQGDGDIVFLFSIKETKKATTFGTISTKNAISTTDYFSYGEVRIYKPDRSKLEFTTRAEIVDDKLQAIFERKHIDALNEVGIHKLQIHLYDSEAIENRFTIPPVDLHVLFPIGYDTTLIDEAIVDYSLLDSRAEYIPTFDAEGNYNRTVWETGDIITQDKLNKLEDALYEINAADSNFVTNEVLETELANKANKAHNHTTANITGLARVATSGSYNDLSNKPSMATYATKTELSDKADKNHTHTNYASASHTHNEYAATNHTHTGYATAADVVNKADKGHTHSEYIEQSALSNYATKSYVDNSGFITSIPSEYVTEGELENTLATKTYATIAYVNTAISNAGGFSGGGSGEDGYDHSQLATKIELNAKADKDHTHAYLVNVPDKYATKDYVNEAIENANIGGGSINPDDLADYATKDEMAVALIGKADADHAHDDKYAVYNHTHDDYALKSDIPDVSEVEVPKDISYFNNDAGYVTNADVNDAINEAVGDINEGLDNYAKKTDIPTKLSEFTNDSDYITSNTITRIEIVNKLPETEEIGVLYIVKE